MWKGSPNVAGQGVEFSGQMLTHRVRVRLCLGLALTALLMAGCGATALTPRRSPTPTQLAPTPNASPTPAPSPIQAVDLTWVSDEQGWALATTPTCAGVTCVAVLATINGGQSWSTLAQLDVCLMQCPVNAEVVGHIRFATPEIGYLYGAEYGTSPMMVTTDGGYHWTVEPGPYTVALDVSGGEAMRISSPNDGCPGPCDPTIDVAPLGSNQWTTVFVPTPTYYDGGALVRQGADVYTLFPGNPAGGASSTQHADLYISQDGGSLWQHEDDPCGFTGTMADDAESMAAAPQGVLVVLCVPRGGTGSDFLIVSTDAGASFGSREQIPSGFAQLAAASASNLVVGNADAIGGLGLRCELLYSSDGGEQWHTVVDQQAVASAVPPSFLGFESVADGRWICPDSILWTTTDSGATWSQSPF